MNFLLILAALTHAAHSAPAGKPENKTLWKEWYLYSVGGEPQGYFEEVAESRPGEKHLAVTQRWVEKENGRMETYIGSVASADGKFTPVAFFSERKSKSTSYKIDGRAKNGKLSVTFKPGKPAGKNRKISLAMEGDLVLSNFVPQLLAGHDAASGSLAFHAVVEDAKDGRFDLREGEAEAQGVTRKIRNETCRRYTVVFEGVPAEWWITKEGKLCELTLSANRSKLELSSEKEAKKALGE